MPATTKALSRGRRIALFCAIAAAGVIADQLSKACMRSALAAGRTTLLPGIMDLVLVENTGAAFSLGEGAGALFCVVALVVVAAALLFVVKTDDIPASLVITLACVAGGGIGNLIDRVVFGSVTDFFCTTFIDYPVFNVADILITCGVIASLAIYMHWDHAREIADAAEQGSCDVD